MEYFKTFSPFGPALGHGKDCSIVKICFRVRHCFFLAFKPVCIEADDEFAISPDALAPAELDTIEVCGIVPFPEMYECWKCFFLKEILTLFQSVDV